MKLDNSKYSKQDYNIKNSTLNCEHKTAHINKA